jgi:hypothetical protein
VTEDQDHDAGQPASQRAALAGRHHAPDHGRSGGTVQYETRQAHALRDQLERVRMRNERLRELEECPELRREVVTLADIAAWRNG